MTNFSLLYELEQNRSLASKIKFRNTATHSISDIVKDVSELLVASEPLNPIQDWKVLLHVFLDAEKEFKIPNSVSKFQELQDLKGNELNSLRIKLSNSMLQAQTLRKKVISLLNSQRQIIEASENFELALKSSKPLSGEWRHSNGYICCGTLRVLITDIDTNPSKEFVDTLLDWICKTLNAAK